MLEVYEPLKPMKYKKNAFGAKKQAFRTQKYVSVKKKIKLV